MGMPISVEIVRLKSQQPINQVFDFFVDIDNRFSPYKPDSELSRLNQGANQSELSDDMKQILSMCEETKQQTGGYFDINKDGKIDTSGLVKGWAIYKGVEILKNLGLSDFYIEAGGDIQVEGFNDKGEPWEVGIRSPFNINDVIKIVHLSGMGIATSGAYIRGEHIYNPKQNNQPPRKIKSMTVIGPNIYEADRFATAAYAMGESGISFIAGLPGFEGYMIDDKGVATYTGGFEDYVG